MSKQRGMKKQQQVWVEQARAAGWRIKQTKSGVMLFPTNRELKPITLHASSQQKGRGRDAERQRLKKAGLKV